MDKNVEIEHKCLDCKHVWIAKTQQNCCPVCMSYKINIYEINLEVLKMINDNVYKINPAVLKMIENNENND